MSSRKERLRLIGAVGVLAIAALGVACRGFFVNPTITSITINPPNPNVSQGDTRQLTAAGTDSNGNAVTLTGGTSCAGTTVCWSSSTPTVATISTGGLLKGISAGTTSITASSGTATGTTTATVTLGNVTAINVQPSSISLPVSSTATGTQCLKATASAGGTSTDVTASVTWQTGNTSLITVQNGQDPMCPISSSTPGQTTIFATYVSNNATITSNSVTVNVTQ
jgi:Bacterial Ig-like domain (group 2)